MKPNEIIQERNKLAGQVESINRWLWDRREAAADLQARMAESEGWAVHELFTDEGNQQILAMALMSIVGTIRLAEQDAVFSNQAETN